MGVIPNPYQNPDQESKETTELRPKNLIEGTTALTCTHNTLIIMNQGIVQISYLCNFFQKALKISLVAIF